MREIFSLVISLIISVVFLWLLLTHTFIKEDNLQEGLEYAYFEGQRDFMEGNIRIKLNQDSCYVWKASPWDNGKKPIYDPSFNCVN